MKFIHIADLHFDRPFVSLQGNKELSKKRKLEQKYNFRRVIEYIKEHGIELLFISGDLFEQKYVTDDTIQYINSCFREIPDTKIFISPGNHDPLIQSSPYNKFSWEDNVYIFGSEVGKYQIDNINIYGFAFDDYFMDRDVISEIKVDDSMFNVLVGHCTLNGSQKKYNDVKEEQLKIFDYSAIGHIHLKKVDKSRIIYPGSLTACGFDEPGEHGMVVGEFKYDFKEKKKIVDYEFVKVDETEFERIEIDISNINSYQELIDKLNLGKNIYKIELNGTRNFDTSKFEEEVKLVNKNVCIVEDNTHTKYDFKTISKEETLKGIFVKKMLMLMDEKPEDKDKILRSYRVSIKYYEREIICK